MKTNSRIRLNLSAKTAYMSFGVIAAGAVLWGGISLRTRAATPAGAQADSSSHPAPPSVAIWEVPSPNSPRLEPPISLAFETADGNALYTRRVNQITSRAVQGDREWLGTHLGVKVVDSKTNRVRHYTRRDGLPGDYVEDIVADVKGVFCIVRVGSGAGRIALCTLDKASEKWKTLQEAKPLLIWNSGNEGWQEGGNWQRLRGRSRLALNSRMLLFAPATVGRETDAVLYAFDRSANTVRAVTWDSNVRADNPVLGVSFLGLSDTHAFLGTNIGLFTIPLPSGKASADTEATWQRSLADRFVDGGALSPDGKTLWLAVHNRLPKTSATTGQRESNIGNEWSLVNFDTNTRRITPTAPLGGSAQTFPETVTLDATGDVWLTSRALGESRRLLFIGKETPPVFAPDRFDRYSPATNSWAHMTLSGDVMTPTVTATPFSNSSLPPSPPPGPAKQNRVPDAAVLELAFDRATDDSALAGNGGFYSRDDYYSPLRQPQIWVRTRFPQWYCSAEREPIRPTYSFVRDPTKPGWVWASQDRTLIHHPEAAQSSPAEAVRYTFEGGSPLLVRPRVETIVAYGGDSNKVIVHTVSGVFEIQDSSPEWKPLYRPDGNGSSFDALNNQMVRVGPDNGAILLRLWGNKQPLRFLDTTSGRFEDSSILSPPDSTLIAGGTRGAWYRNGQRNIAYFVPLGADAHSAGPVETIDPATVPPELVPPAANRFFSITGATGDIVWFTAHLRRRPTDRSHNSDTHTQSVIGYDRVRHRWTTPTELDPAFGSTYIPFLGSDGATYIPYDTLGSAVLRYVAITDKWEKVAAPLPKMAELNDRRSRSALTLIAAGGKQEICLTDWKYLYRYDSEREKWSYEPLPQPLQGNSSPFTLQWRTAATKGSYWIGSEQGLWRYDTAKRTWQERELAQALASASEATTGGSSDSPTDVSLYPRAVDSHSVWGTLVPRRGEHGAIFRFDRATKEFTLYNQKNGVPVKEYNNLMSDGDGLWTSNQNGSYRLDPKTGKATMMFRSQYSEDAPADEEVRQSIPIGSVGAIQEDPVDANAAYVLLNSAGGTLYPNDAQPTILYRVDRRSGKLTPLPIPSTVLVTLKEQNTGEPYFTRAPSITGSGGLLVGRKSNGTELWVGTTAGVFRIDPVTNTWRLADLPPGVPRFNAGSIFPAPNGSGIWIQSYNGDVLQLPKNAGTAPQVTTMQRNRGNSVSATLPLSGTQRVPSQKER